MTGRLEGTRALVTGAAGRIGRGVVARLAEEGARVVAADLDGDGVEALAEASRARGLEVSAHQVDLVDPDAVRAMVETGARQLGGLDLLHNNAAATGRAGEDGDLLSISPERWEQTFAVNVRAPMLACQAAVPLMRAAGGGSIVNTSSTAAEVGDLWYTAYAASKGALNALTRSIATQYGPDGIRCNAIAPGLVRAEDHLAGMDPAVQQEFERQHLAPRLGRPADVAAMVAFLGSDDAAWITGQVIRVDGGLLSHSPTTAAMRELHADQASSEPPSMGRQAPVT